MSRRSAAVRAAAVATLLLAWLPSAEARKPPAPKRPTAVGVGEREFRLSPYRDRVVLGSVRFYVHNFGEDVHDLAVLSPHGRRVASTEAIVPGEGTALDVRLKRPGRYVLICTRADHAARGMRARIVVRKPRVRPRTARH
jgi:plastocyanin